MDSTQPTKQILSPSPNPKSTKSSRKKKIVIAAIVAGIIIIGIIAVNLFGNTLPKTDMKVVDSLGETPTKEDVAKLDKSELFWAYFKNASQQQKLVVTKTEGKADADQSFVKTGIDYSTKKFVRAEEQHKGDKVVGRIRCYDGNTYIPRSEKRLDNWESYGSDNPVYQCRQDKRGDTFNDGVNTGGLTADQAQQFVGTLRAQEGLVQVKTVDLVQRNNRSYLHFAVDVVPAYGPNGTLKFGGGWLMMAFRKTGLDPIAQPYGYTAAEGHGFAYEYYVDPTAKLPVYSELYLHDREGKPVRDYAYKTLYEFGTATFDATTRNMAPLSLKW